VSVNGIFTAVSQVDQISGDVTRQRRQKLLRQEMLAMSSSSW